MQFGNLVVVGRTGKALGTIMVTYVIDAGIVVIHAVGDYVLADVLAAIRAALADPSLPAPAPLLLDVTASTSTRTQKELVELAGFIRDARGLLSGRCALLVGDALRFGLAREFGGWAASRGVSVEVFNEGSLADARRWLLGGSAGDPSGGGSGR